MEQQEQTCVICLATFPPYRHGAFAPPALPCGHNHCPACLVRGFLTATKSLPFTPATCCSPTTILPPSTFRPFFGSLQIAEYRAKLAEYLTPAKLYCHHPTCSAFIPALLRGPGKQAKCRVCCRRTCAVCKGRAHMGGCPDESDEDEDEEADSQGAEQRRRDAIQARSIREAERRRKIAKRQEQASKDLIKAMGWKHCPECLRVVEKTEGCNHIKCICGCHWCYRCGRAPYGAHGACAM